MKRPKKPLTKAFPIALAILALSLPPGLAAAPSNRTGSAPGSGDAQGRPASAATLVLRCLVTHVGDDGTLRMRPERGEGQEVVVSIPETLRIRAQDKKAFDGRKKLAFSDLKKGQRVRVTADPAGDRLISIVVLRDKSST